MQTHTKKSPDSQPSRPASQPVKDTAGLAFVAVDDQPPALFTSHVLTTCICNSRTCRQGSQRYTQLPASTHIFIIVFLGRFSSRYHHLFYFWCPRQIQRILSSFLPQ